MLEVSLVAVVFGIIMTLLFARSLRGRHEMTIPVDGRTFQLPAWAFAESTQYLTTAEESTIAVVGQYELALRRAERDHARAKSPATAHALADATAAFTSVQQDAQVAVTNGVRRWLLSESGQTWLESRGLRFP